MNKEAKISVVSTSTQELREKKSKKKKKRKTYTSSDSDSDERDKKESKKRKVSTSSDSDSYRKKKKKHKHKRKKEKSKKLMKEGKIAKPNEDTSVENVDRILLDRAKAMAPMTKEEWEKRQNVVRRVYDKETNRHRLIKGDGEVLEEIVSKERHKEINRKATKGDGEFFQSQVSTLSSR